MIERPTLTKEVESLLNRYGAERPSNTPDFILAAYLMGCLKAFNDAVVAREKWYGRDANGEPAPTMPLSGSNRSD